MNSTRKSIAAQKWKQYKHGETSLGLVINQDAYNLPFVQRGMNSAAYEGLWLGDQELRIRHFHKTLEDYLSGASMRIQRKRPKTMATQQSTDQLLNAYRQMKTIREFEERLHKEIMTGEIAGFTHLYSGQEAVAVGVCDHL